MSAKKKADTAVPRCRVCGCTEADACANACEWAEQGLCTTCDDAAGAIAMWMMDARRIRKTALMKEAERQFGGMPVPYLPTGKFKEDKKKK